MHIKQPPENAPLLRSRRRMMQARTKQLINLFKK